LAGGAALLALAGLGVVVAKYGFRHDYLLGLARKFDLDREMNVPTWFSSALLLLAAVLLIAIGAMARREHDGYARHWLVLGCTFLLLSLDETAGLHGLLSAPVRRALGLHGAFYFAWVVPIGIAVCAFALAYLRFVWHLPRSTRRLVVASAIVYVAGALGGELVEGFYFDAAGETLTFALVTVVEETLEMAGAILFIYTLLRYIASRWSDVRISVGA
jgi:hypothetical protein